MGPEVTEVDERVIFANPETGGLSATVADLIYTAGLFDGEGCVSLPVGKSAHKTAQYRALVVAVGMADEPVIRWLATTYGGSINLRDHSADGNKDQWHWRLHGEAAADWLRLIRPWLRVKAEQADIGIEYQSVRVDRSVRHLGVPAELIAKRESLHARLAHLNRRGA